MSTPLERAQAKLEDIERELKKHPDFQLYLLTHTQQDRARMEVVLMNIPAFELWRKLRNTIALTAAATPEAISTTQQSNAPLG